MFGVEKTNLVTPPKFAAKEDLNFYQRIINQVFAPMHIGKLTIILPSGAILCYGKGVGGVEATIRVINNDFFKKCVLFGDVGFGESYVDGDWETDDISAVIEWMISNVKDHPTLMADSVKKAPVNFFKWINNCGSVLRRNSIKGSKKNIQDHYDLGNEFFKTFLDPTMTYSCAYYKREECSLQEAQYHKYEELCRKLKLKHMDHLLEIGSGWGGLAIYAAKNFGCRVTTTTISKEQYVYAQEQIKKEGLSHQITIVLEDYRRLKGKYDKIVSVEMLEAVGHEYYETYFKQIHELLNPNGMAGIQVILSPDNRYESFRTNTDWIQKHIFPGSLLPSYAVIHQNINKTGTLNLFHYEDMTAFYVKTLAAWHRNFNLKRAQIFSLNLDETFIRKWNYYWCYCMAAFKTRNIYVAQMIFTRPNTPIL